MGSQTKNSHSLQAELLPNKTSKFQKMKKPVTFLTLVPRPPLSVAALWAGGGPVPDPQRRLYWDGRQLLPGCSSLRV